jgi:hypothetical protein
MTPTQTGFSALPLPCHWQGRRPRGSRRLFAASASRHPSSPRLPGRFCMYTPLSVLPILLSVLHRVACPTDSDSRESDLARPRPAALMTPAGSSTTCRRIRMDVLIRPFDASIRLPRASPACPPGPGPGPARCRAGRIIRSFASCTRRSL